MSRLDTQHQRSIQKFLYSSAISEALGKSKIAPKICSALSTPTSMSMQSKKNSVICFKRRPQSFGKIVKNGSICKVKTQASINQLQNSKGLKNSLQKFHKKQLANNEWNSQKSKSLQKYELKSQSFLQKYETKLAVYEKNKREVLRDIGRINNNDFIYKKEEEKCHLNKTQNFLILKLKNSLKSSVLKNKGERQKYFQQQEIADKAQAGNKFLCQKQNNLILNRALSSSNQKLCNKLVSNSKKSSEMAALQANTSEYKQKQKFIHELDKQIRLETNFRKLRNQVDSTNRKIIKQILSRSFSAYDGDQDRLIKIHYQQYEFVPNEPPQRQAKNGQHKGQPSNSQILTQILAQKLIETYYECENNWKRSICKKFKPSIVKYVYELLNYQNRVQMDLKTFTRQFNIRFARNYQPKDLYTFYMRISPMTKANFMYIFSY